MTKDRDVEVLVVGAGPTGLALAAMLGRTGIAVRVIDKAAERSRKSKALGVHAGTLEALSDVFGLGLPARMVSTGQPVRTVHFHLGRRRPIAVDLGGLPSPYNFVLVLPQGETERLLAEQAAAFDVAVDWKHELTGLRQDRDGVQCEVRRPDGAVELVRAAYVVGCDGAHSVVRRQVGAQFAGGAYPGTFLLADVTLDWGPGQAHWGHDSVRFFSTEAGAMAFFPLKDPAHAAVGPTLCRLVVIPKEEPPVPGAEIDLATFATLARAVSGLPLALGEATWLTRFTIHHRMVKRLRHGRVFLAGDAAHIHSPAGGQGMNTGIQDALNLGARLTEALRRAAPDKVDAVLDRYAGDRLPVARGVLRGTDLISRVGLLADGWWGRLLRRHILPLVIGSPFLRRRIALTLSQLPVSRQERPVRLRALD
ncbi:FAD-dependent monooxygenase [Nitrospirillum pindoramense]|uniref:2-polyprenyl-6-methoxyphenol hydroxylase-like FAD-dependent oxidoreductase n=1 Tax=Nitrospirillum amazonense TaxID=28077 RepID=A0A560H2H3_9PROT|nr:FAD-dependent monooxygenase [Nitrospirillum amazonense]TWB40512.1 2-polyprenyl-6-methoxyphenol hydroxylase-like FAD-dependent oxidoreductase [Nitrospirillum amazonense]